MNRLKQLERYRQKNNQKKILELMREIYRQNLLKQARPMTYVQQARVNALAKVYQHS